MNMNFKRKLPIPKEIKEMYPISEEGALAKEKKKKLLQQETAKEHLIVCCNKLEIIKNYYL